MLDLDDFKRVNDVYGHAIGDTVLADVAELLHEGGAPGGHRLPDRRRGVSTIVVPGGDLDVALTLARRLATQLEQVEFAQAGRISISLGVAIGPHHAANPRELVACAEAAMMTAKARGKNRVVFDEDATERPGAGAPRPATDARSRI